MFLPILPRPTNPTRVPNPNLLGPPSIPSPCHSEERSDEESAHVESADRDRGRSFAALRMTRRARGYLAGLAEATKNLLRSNSADRDRGRSFAALRMTRRGEGLPSACRSGRSSAQLPSPAGDQSLVVIGAAAARDPQKSRGLGETVPVPDQRQKSPLDFGHGGSDPIQELTRLEFRQRRRRLRFRRRVERTPFSHLLAKTPSPVPKDEIPGDRGEPGHRDDQHRRALSQQPKPDVLGDVVRLGLSKARVDATRQDPGIGFRDPRLRFATGSETDLPPRIARGRPPHHSLRPRVLAGFFLSPSARSILKSEVPHVSRGLLRPPGLPEPPRLRTAKIF